MQCSNNHFNLGERKFLLCTRMANVLVYGLGLCFLLSACIVLRMTGEIPCVLLCVGYTGQSEGSWVLRCLSSISGCTSSNPRASLSSADHPVGPLSLRSVMVPLLLSTISPASLRGATCSLMPFTSVDTAGYPSHCSPQSWLPPNCDVGVHSKIWSLPYPQRSKSSSGDC